MNPRSRRRFTCRLVHLLALLYWPLAANTTAAPERIARPDGDVDWVEKQDGSPFTTYRRELHNSGSADREVRMIEFVHEVPLTGAAKDYRTLGVDGLKAADSPASSYLFLAIAKPDASAGTVAGWITQERGSGSVHSQPRENRLSITGRLEFGRLLIKPGQKVVTDAFVIGSFADTRLGLETYADAIAKVNQIKLPKIPSGFCSWYSHPHGGAGDEKAMKELGAFCGKELTKFGFDTILVDDQWQGPSITKGGVMANGPTGNFTRHNPKGPYPSGMKANADQLAAQGIRPGLWFTPFSWDPRDPLFKEHQDWFVKKSDRSLYEVLWAGWCLDMTHPDARAFLADSVRRLTKDWGYRYLKPDAMWCGLAAKCTYPGTAYVDESFGDAVFHDPSMTNIDAYRAGIRTMREAAGPDTYIAACNVAQNFRSMGGAMGLVDAMRIGPDTGADWAAILPNFHLGSRLYFLHNRVWHNDPDCLMVREPLTLTQARSFASWIAVTGSLNLISEWLPGLPADRLDCLKRSIPNTGLAGRPLDLFESMPARVWQLTDGKRQVVGFFNWDAGKAATATAKLDQLGFKETDGEFIGLDYWSGKLVPIRDGVVTAELPPSGCSVIAVAKTLDRPQLLGTSRHITQCFVDVGDDRWDDTRLSGTCKLVGGDPTELRIATSSTVGAWKPVAASVSKADQEAGVTVSMKEENGLLRISLGAPANREVQWSVQFEKSMPQNNASVDGVVAPPVSPLMLWYRSPAKRWLEALPVGNGRLGAMVFGGVETERLALNESTFWSGAPGSTHENPQGREQLPVIRKLMFDGQYPQAVDLISKNLLGRQGNFGTHLPVGDLLLRMDHPKGPVADFRRELNPDEAIATVSYTIDGVRFTREVIATHADNVIAMRLTADKPGKVSFNLDFKAGGQGGKVQSRGNDSLVITADAREKKHSDGATGVSLAGLIRAIPTGGQVLAKGETLEVTHADSVTLLIALNTTFKGGQPLALCEQQLARAAAHEFPVLRQRHVSDHQPLFRRVSLDLGPSPAAQLPTDERLARLRKGEDDPALIAQFFQYGRYLLIAGSREDSPLPANLQGIWNDNLACNMGWTCDFHLDINTQQNYWPTEVCNLSECHEPLFRFIESLREPGRRTAQTVYGARGWVAHTVTNAWGYTAPGWWTGWGTHPTAGTWIASHLWQRYQFTGDREFLRNRAYPTLKEAAEFFLDYMVVDPKTGFLLTGPSTSPENSFVAPNGQGVFSESMGPTCDIVLVRDLFTSCIEASQTLKIDDEFRGKMEQALSKLPPLRIGKHGQLMEWFEDFDEAVPNHRHTTHLISLYPSAQITPRSTPELAQAARVTLQRRLSRPDWEDVEWSRANLINFYARLGDGEESHKHVLGLLREDTDADLLTFSRGGIAGAPENIFIVDGNFAGTAGIAEMLLQSHGGEIELLPALPKAWPNGAVNGLNARGGVTVDIEWKDGKVSAFKLRSPEALPVKVRVNGESKMITPERG